jgi:hypothetical protein
MLQEIDTPEMTTSIDGFVDHQLTNTKPKFSRLNLQDIIDENLPLVLKYSLEAISNIDKNTGQTNSKSNILEACQILKIRIPSELFIGANSHGRVLVDQIKEFECNHQHRLLWYQYWLDQTKIDFGKYQERRVKFENCELIYQNFLSYVYIFLKIIPFEKGYNEEDILNYHTDQLIKASQSFVGFQFYLQDPEWDIGDKRFNEK